MTARSWSDLVVVFDGTESLPTPADKEAVTIGAGLHVGHASICRCHQCQDDRRSRFAELLADDTELSDTRLAGNPEKKAP